MQPTSSALTPQKRHASDRDLNARKAKVLVGDQFVDKAWRKIRVGDIVRLQSDDFFPADLVLLSSSEPDALCYIETSNLDGETNLKIKQGAPATAALTSPEMVARLAGQLRSEQPNNSLYTYEGTLVLGDKQVPLDPAQMLLRGAQLRNTAWMYGLVVFTGHETKLMRNATATPIKRTAVERMVNTQIVFLFVILLLLSVGSSAGAFVRNVRRRRSPIALTRSSRSAIRCGICCSARTRAAGPSSSSRTSSPSSSSTTT